jgi:hypothetical protein
VDLRQASRIFSQFSWKIKFSTKQALI